MLPSPEWNSSTNVGALTKNKLCQLSKLKYSAHADFLVTQLLLIVQLNLT